jgi:hypothetical protein
MNEPSGLLIFGILFVLILGIIGLIALVGTIADHRGEIWRAMTQRARAPRRPASTPPRSIRDRHGHFRGSRSAAASVPAGNEWGNDRERRSEVRTASERGGTAVPAVPSVLVSVTEAALIGQRLGQGMAPSDVAKSLPGYSGKKYAEYVEKVRQVKAALDQEAARAGAPEAQTA